MKRQTAPPKTSNDRAPMCRICDHRHWSRDPHVFTSARKQTKKTTKRKVKKKGAKK